MVHTELEFGYLNVRSRSDNMSQWQDNIKMDPHEVELGLVLD